MVGRIGMHAGTGYAAIVGCGIVCFGFYWLGILVCDDIRSDKIVFNV